MNRLPHVAVIGFLIATTACAFRVDSGDELNDRSFASRKNHATSTKQTTSPSTSSNDDNTVQPSQQNSPPPPPWNPGPVFTGLRTGHIAGAVGYATLDEPSDLASVYDDGEYAQISVYARRSDGVRVMLQLQVENGPGGPFLQPGLAIRMEPGAQHQGATILGVGCAGPDSGQGNPDDAFQYTDFDQQPCDTGVGTQQDPNDPNALDVTLQAVFADDNGNCDPMPGDNGDGTAPLPDPNGGCDGSTDPNNGSNNGSTTPTDPNNGSTAPTDPNNGSTTPTDPNSGSTGGDSAHPLARASFVLTR